jgi:hypothetical protein
VPGWLYEAPSVLSVIVLVTMKPITYFLVTLAKYELNIKTKNRFIIHTPVSHGHDESLIEIFPTPYFLYIISGTFASASYTSS